jgi:hypothetical protein
VLNKKFLENSELTEFSEFREFYSWISRILGNFEPLEKIILEILVMWKISFFHCLFLGNWRKQFSKFAEFVEDTEFTEFTKFLEFREFSEFGE